MNPHDQLTHPGAHLVYERLGARNAWELNAGYPGSDPLGRLAVMVASSAREVDQLHQELAARAQTVIERLEPIARGDHATMRGVNGIIQSAGLQVELLTARRGAAYEQLSSAVNAYGRCTDAGLPTPESRLALKDATASVAPVPAAAPDLPGASAGYDPRVREFEALATIDRGGLWLCKSAVYGYKFMSDGSGESPSVWPQTVEELIAEDLVVADTSSSSYRLGHLLSLTPAGKALLDASRAADQRVSAALSRSATGPTTPPAARPAPATPSVSAQPTRSR
ncbi:hypothetical protein AB0D10_35895 [Kitasatospora sp. NPDC048545]|uniref:hypothetical protein n=1 Tax=Kitasatospora sp. NPDC048545 TaxID=3157208 RepID=UPI0033C24A72